MTPHPWRSAAVFIVLSSLVLAVVGVVMGEFRFDDRKDYAAVFSNINGLDEGSDVRAVGVSVGRVGEIELRDDGSVLVPFSVGSGVPLETTTRAAVRYQSLTGVKYLELLPGEAGATGTPLAEGGTLSLASTDPGLDLDAVFNGFQPLMQSLSPDEVNELSASVIEVFQGQTGAVGSLLAHLARLTGTLGDRSEVIDTMIVNFRDVLGTLDGQRDDLDLTVRNVRTLVRGLARDRNRIVGSFAAASDLADEGASLLEALRPRLTDTRKGIDAATGAFNSDTATVDHYLAGLPVAISKLRRLGAYGSFYSLYMCSVRVTVSTPLGESKIPDAQDQSERCQFPGDAS